ncbi:ankyrin repeat domain-containing protein [Thiotrichales bacterium 19X7-9]|nr:ankyrin repeat domain-containing protein [Thiotrichales bacterium 19X7-9]
MTFQEAIASQNINNIKESLADLYENNQLDQISTSLQKAFKVIAPLSGKEKTMSLVECLLYGNRLEQDIDFINIAQKLIDMGAVIPGDYKNDTLITSEYLKGLSENYQSLFIALANDPDIVNKQDENGQTLLHHAAKIGRTLGSNSASLILDQLFNSPYADFNIQDKDGNTPLHIAAYASNERVTCRFVFPNFVEEAIKRNVDLNKLNNAGQAIIHILARTAYSDPYRGEDNNMKPFLEMAKGHLNINQLSSSGSTALYYSINWLRLDVAESLLEAGANTSVNGQALDRNPVEMLNKHISDALDKEKKLDIKLLKNLKNLQINIVQTITSKDDTQQLKNHQNQFLFLEQVYESTTPLTQTNSSMF